VHEASHGHASLAPHEWETCLRKSQHSPACARRKPPQLKATFHRNQGLQSEQGLSAPLIAECCVVERDPEPILPTRIETTLFGALDSETDAATAAQLKATIQTLLAAGAPTRPSHYLATCSAVVLAATAAVSGAGGGKAQEALQGARPSPLGVSAGVFSLLPQTDACVFCHGKS